MTNTTYNIQHRTHERQIINALLALATGLLTLTGGLTLLIAALTITNLPYLITAFLLLYSTSNLIRLYQDRRSDNGSIHVQ